MARLSADRDTHLDPGEIAAEMLRQFDIRDTEPSIRSLATVLQVAPTAIYHHFPSRAAVVQSAVELVWGEAVKETVRMLPRPFEADPEEVLVAAGLATRRAWLAHHRLARYMAATPEATRFTRGVLELMADVFVRRGLEGEHAAEAFHGYCTFMIGAVLFAADRRTANEALGADRPAGAPIHADPASNADRTRRLMDEAMDLSIVDPDRDEQLFENGLRRLIHSLVAERPGPTGA